MRWVEVEVLYELLRSVRPALFDPLTNAFLPVTITCDADTRYQSARGVRKCLSLPMHREISDFRQLGELGLRLLEASDPLARQLGCEWLTYFPSETAISAWEARLLDNAEHQDVRHAALAALCHRSLGDKNENCRWQPEWEEKADAVLLQFVQQLPKQNAPTRKTLRQLMKVRASSLWDWIAEEVHKLGPTIGCFGTERYARALITQFDQLGAHEQAEATALIAEILGEEAVGWLRTLTPASLPVKRAATQCLLSLGHISPAHLEDALRPHTPFVEQNHRFCKMFAASLTPEQPFPLIAARRVTHSSALLNAEQHRERAAQFLPLLLDWADVEPFATSDLWSALGDFALHHQNPTTLCRLLLHQHHPLGHHEVLVPQLLEALTAMARFVEMEALAKEHHLTDHAAWLAARRGRPYQALRLCSATPLATERSTAARALALLLAGRPDLSNQVLRHHPPPVRGDKWDNMDFPGPDEKYRLEHPRSDNHEDLLLAALCKKDVSHLLPFVQPPPAGASPDPVDLSLIEREHQRLTPSLQGKSIVLLGEARKDPALIQRLETQGARVLLAPFLGADYFLAGAGTSSADIARLRAKGLSQWVGS